MATKTKNAHRVTRHLTRPWECVDGNHSQYLWYFDFVSGKVASRSSRTLLTSPEAYDQRVENWRGRMIESPLAEAIGAYAASTPSAPPSLSATAVRAVLLAVFLQAQFNKASNGDSHALNTIIQHVDDEVWWNGLTGLFLKSYAVVGYRLPANTQLFFPSLGVTTLPLQGCEPGFLLPVLPSMFLACYPRTLPREALNAQLNALVSSGKIVLLSLGLMSRHAVIPPQLMQTYSAGHWELWLPRYRELMRGFVQAVAEWNAAAGTAPPMAFTFGQLSL